VEHETGLSSVWWRLPDVDVAGGRGGARWGRGGRARGRADAARHAAEVSLKVRGLTIRRTFFQRHTKTQVSVQTF